MDILTITLAILIGMSCNDTTPNPGNMNESEQMDTEDSMSEVDSLAKIISVSITGIENEYTFSVGISSPDTGCDQYADWWEILSEDGILIYRRILGHSHVNEQPFIRSGGDVSITPDQKVIVRAHMNNAGNGLETYQGSVTEGFEMVTIESGFADHVESQEPQPGDCSF